MKVGDLVRLTAPWSHLYPGRRILGIVMELEWIGCRAKVMWMNNEYEIREKLIKQLEVISESR